MFYHSFQVLQKIFFILGFSISRAHSNFLKTGLMDRFKQRTCSEDINFKNLMSFLAMLYFLKHLINISFAAGIFPEILKDAKVLPLHKGGSKLEENNYRPISLLVIWSKIYESAMSTRVYNFFESCNLLSNCQFGFRSKQYHRRTCRINRKSKTKV